MSMFDSYLASLGTEVHREHQVPLAATSRAVIHNAIIESYVMPLAERHLTQDITHYLAVIGTVASAGQPFGEFVIVRTREEARAATRWIVTMGGNLKHEPSASVPYMSMQYATFAVKNALIGAMRHGHLNELKTFELSLETVLIHKKVHRKEDEFQFTTRTPTTPIRWHC